MQEPAPEPGPAVQKGSIWRRGFAVLVDLIAAQILLQLIATVLYPLSGGALIDTNSFITSCISATSRPADIKVPEAFAAGRPSICTKSLIGLPTARLFVVTRDDPTTHGKSTVAYAIDQNDRPRHSFDLGTLDAVAFVAMRWLLARLGRRSLGRRWLSLAVVSRTPDGWLEPTRAAIDRRYIRFGLPLLPSLTILAITSVYRATVGPLDPETLVVVTFLGNLPVTVALYVAIAAISRRHDTFYDSAAGTVVARLADGALHVESEARARADATWVARASESDKWPVFGRPVPWVSLGLSLALVLVYLAECLYPGAEPRSHAVPWSTLLQFGGMSHELVWVGGQWYRLVFSIFLHASLAHLLANTAVFLAAGWLLEGVLGAGWLLATFLLGGIAASVTSITVNPANIVSVGASGAVTAVVAAGLVVSVRLQNPVRRLWLQAFCLACLLATLQASGSFSWGTIDRADHAGGAVAGFLLGLGMSVLWRRHRPEPAWQRLAGAGATIACAALVLSIPFTGFTGHSLAALLIPTDELPKTDQEWTARSADLVRRYPGDPRSHLARAMAAEDTTARNEEIERAVAAQRRLNPTDLATREQEIDVIVGKARAAVQDWSGALALYNRAMAVGPSTKPEPYGDRADAEEELGLFDAALDDPIIKANLEPTSADDQIRVADVFFMKREPAAAIRALDKALVLSPGNGLALRQRGWIAFFDHRSALVDLEQAASLRPGDPYAALWLEIVRTRTGSSSILQSIATANKLTEGEWPGPVVRFYLGEIDAADLKKAADTGDAETKAGRLCEFDFYTGEWNLMRHDEAAAQPLLSSALQRCPKGFYEWAAAQAELGGGAGFKADQTPGQP